MRSGRWVALYLGIALMLTSVHAVQVNFGHKAAKRAERHELVIEGRGKAPWAYRVLNPVLVEAVQPALRPLVGDEHTSRELAYLGLRWVFTSALLLLLHGFLRTWLSPPWALSGTLLVAALHPATYQYYWFQPDSPADLALWAAAALAAVRGRYAVVLPLVVVGTVNRETALFAVLVYGALAWGRVPARQLAVRLVGLFGCWLVPFSAVRLVVGPRPWSGDVGAIAASNLANPTWILYAICFLAPLAILPWLGLRRRPPELVRLAVALTVTYLPMQVVFGRVREVRLLLPLALAYAPLVILALREAVQREPAGE